VGKTSAQGKAALIFRHSSSLKARRASMRTAPTPWPQT
jgi:hypothetical protein